MTSGADGTATTSGNGARHPDPAQPQASATGTSRRDPAWTTPERDSAGALDDAWHRTVDQAARLIVPRLASFGLVSIFPRQSATSPTVRRRPSHFLIRVADRGDQPASIAPLVSRPLDLYDSFVQIAAGSVQLWRIDGSLVEVIKPDSSAIGVPIPAGETAVAALTLVRLPGQAAFTLDDLVTLESFVGEELDGEDDPAGPAWRRWQPEVLTPSAHVLALRDLMRDLLATDTPYGVARRLAQAAQGFFGAQSCVVYFVDPALAPELDTTTTSDTTRRKPRLQLAASVGSGVFLTPPWLEPADSAAPSSLFATSPNDTVLMARFEPGTPWVESELADDFLIALPLRLDGDLVAVLGLRRPDSLSTMQTVTAENFALISAIGLRASQRRDADQARILGLRSDLARNRLAHDATVAMFGVADLTGGLAAHASVLVPGLADGYLVYLDAAASGIETSDGSPSSPPTRVFTHWRQLGDSAAIEPLGQWVDRHIGMLEPQDDRPTVRPILLNDLERHQAANSPATSADHSPTSRSLAAVPLTRSDRRVGWLVLATTEHGRRFSQRDLGLIASLAEPIDRFLSARPRLTTSTHHTIATTTDPDDKTSGPDQADLIAGIASQLIRTGEIEEICQLVARTLATGLGDWCAIELRGGSGEPNRTTGAHVDPDQEWPARFWRRLIQSRDAPRGPAHVLRSGQSDLSTPVTWFLPSSDQEQADVSPVIPLIPSSSIAAAIVDCDEVVGVIGCFRSSKTRPFTLVDLATVESVAAITGDAIAAARLRTAERVAGDRDRSLAEQRTRLIAQLADAVIVIDQERRIIFANESARELHGGADLPDSVGDYVCRYRPVRFDGAAFSEETFPLAVTLATGTRQRGAWRFGLDDGTMVAVVGRAAPLRGRDGIIDGAVLSLHDVTEAEGEQTLRHRLMLEIAEELRPPIGSIKGWIQYLGQRLRPAGETSLDIRSGDAIDAIGKQTRILQQLVDHLVAVSRNDPINPDSHQGSSER